MKLSVFAILLIVTFTFSTNTASAQTLCSYGATGTITANEAIDNIGIEFSLPTGVAYSDPFGPAVSAGGAVGSSWGLPKITLTSGQSTTYTAPIGTIQAAAPPSVAAVGTTNDSTFPRPTGNVSGTITLTGGCTNTPTVAGSSAPAPPPGLPTNSQQGLIIPVNDTSNDSGANQGLEIWAITEQGEGFLAVDLSTEEFASLPTDLEEYETVFEDEDSRVGFYVLPGGALQVNLGPNSEGWVDSIVFDRDFNVTNTYRWNVNDILYPNE